MLMKNFTLVASFTLLLALGSQDAFASRFGRVRRMDAKARTEHAAQVKTDAVRRAQEASKVWLSQTQKYYGWDGNAWDLEDTYNFVYEGTRIASETVTDSEGFVNRLTYTYDGQTTTELSQTSEDGTTFENNMKEVTTVDAIVPSFVVAKYQWNWMDNQWNQNGNNYTQKVTRNADGNVTAVERAVLFQGVFDPIYRLKVTYGDDGKASAITEETLYYDGNEYSWEPGTTYSDIVWHETNGQIVTIDGLPASGNYIKTANVDNGDGEVDQLSFEYADDGSYTGTIKGGNGVDSYESTMLYTPTDDNGSYTLETTTTYSEGGSVMSVSSTEKYVYDSYGLIILEESSFNDGSYDYVDSRIAGKVVYDEINGYPISWEVSVLDWDTEEMVNDARIEYSDYFQASTSGIGSVVSGDHEAPAEYFNLNGVRVNSSALAPGLYIKRQGGKAEKVFVK